MPAYQDAVDFAGIVDGYTPAVKYNAPESDKRLVAKIDELFTKLESNRSSYEVQWEQNRHYLKGDQLWLKNTYTGEVRILSVEDSKRLRSVNNVLRPSARSLIAKLTKLIPTCVAIPPSDDFDEQHGARAADSFLKFFRARESMDIKYAKMASFLIWHGTAFIHLDWDEMKGETVYYCPVCDYETKDQEANEQPCPNCTQQRQTEIAIQQTEYEAAQIHGLADVTSQLPPTVVPSPDMVPDDVEPPPMQQLGPLKPDQEVPNLLEGKEGDVVACVVDPRDVYVPSGCTHIKESELVIIRDHIPVHRARKLHPDFAQFIQADQRVATDNLKGLHSSYGDLYSRADELDDHVYRWRIYERPTPAFEHGRLIVRIGDIIVYEGTPPLHFLNRLPLYMHRFDVNDGEFWGEAPISQAWHRQRELNAVESQQREYAELVVRPKIMNPIGSRVTDEEITAVSQQVIKYNPAVGELKPMAIAPLPQALPLRRDQLTADVRTQFGITETEAGIAGTDPNGRAMAILNAETDQQIGPILLANNEETRELHKDLLKVIQRKYKKGRKWVVAGPEGLQTYSFDELNLDAEYDVAVEQDDGLSRNPAARLTQVIGLANLGLYMDPMTGLIDRKAFSRQAKLKMPWEGYEHEATERAAASRIPFLVREGQQYVPQMWDDPRIFAEELKSWLRGPGRRNPEWAALVFPIWQYYEFWAVQGMMPDFGAALMQGGQPAPGAGPGGADQSAVGGTPNNPGNIGTNQQPIAAQASAQISGADAMAEQSAMDQGF